MIKRLFVNFSIDSSRKSFKNTFRYFNLYKISFRCSIMNFSTNSCKYPSRILYQNNVNISSNFYMNVIVISLGILSKIPKNIPLGKHRSSLTEIISIISLRIILSIAKDSSISLFRGFSKKKSWNSSCSHFRDFE